MDNYKNITINEGIVNVFINYINAITEVAEYNWNTDFKLKTIKETRESLKNGLKKAIDLPHMSVMELISIGFQRWHIEETNEDILLLPLYMYGTLRNGTEVISIFGERKIVGKDRIDNDNRCGCLAYGFLMDYHKANIIVNVKGN